MRKKTFTGWIPKSCKNSLARLPHWKPFVDDEPKLNAIFLTKGSLMDWPKEDWPPVKVKVTVEVI